MSQLIECGLCKSLVDRNRLDGQCGDCGRRTCGNCKRICDRCQMIFCMFDIDVKIVMRQQQPYLHTLLTMSAGVVNVNMAMPVWPAG